MRASLSSFRVGHGWDSQILAEVTRKGLYTKYLLLLLCWYKTRRTLFLDSNFKDVIGKVVGYQQCHSQANVQVESKSTVALRPKDRESAQRLLVLHSSEVTDNNEVPVVAGEW